MSLSTLDIWILFQHPTVASTSVLSSVCKVSAAIKYSARSCVLRARVGRRGPLRLPFFALVVTVLVMACRIPAVHARNILSWPDRVRCLCVVTRWLISWLCKVVHGCLARPKVAVLPTSGEQLEVRPLLNRFALQQGGRWSLDHGAHMLHAKLVLHVPTSATFNEGFH